MSDQPKWLPSDEEIVDSLFACGCDMNVHDPNPEPIRALIRAAVEKALAEHEAHHAREIEKARLEARIEELDNATCTVCQGCAEGIDYWPMDGSHRRQTSDDGDCEGGPCTCHELSDRLHGFRAALAELEEKP